MGGAGERRAGIAGLYFGGVGGWVGVGVRAGAKAKAQFWTSTRTSKRRGAGAGGGAQPGPGAWRLHGDRPRMQLPSRLSGIRSHTKRCLPSHPPLGGTHG
jgi:hypothetical protein